MLLPRKPTRTEAVVMIIHSCICVNPCVTAAFNIVSDGVKEFRCTKSNPVRIGWGLSMIHAVEQVLP